MPTMVWKAIKPQKLKQDVFRLEWLNAMRKVGRKIRKDFEKTTATWTRKPKFEMVISLTAPGPTVVVGTDNEIYGYVDQGTRPHRIAPRNSPYLVFQAGYRPKTRPRFIGSTTGGSFGNTVFARSVMHPGITAREFSVTIQKKWERPFKKEMEQAMKRAVDKSGHRI